MSDFSSSAPQSPAPQYPEPSYFSLKPGRVFSLGTPRTPGDATLSTPGTPANEQSQLLTPNTRLSFLRNPSRTLSRTKSSSALKTPKLSKKESPSTTRLQSKWISKNRPPLTLDTPAVASLSFDGLPQIATQSGDETEVSSVQFARPWQDGDSTDPGAGRSSGESHFTPEITPDHSSVDSGEDVKEPSRKVGFISSTVSKNEIKSASDDDDDDGEGIRRPIVVKDFAIKDIAAGVMESRGRSRELLDPYAYSPGGRQANKRWQERIRSRSSQGSPSPSMSPSSSSMALTSLPSPSYSSGSRTGGSSANLYDPAWNTLVRSKSAKSLDADIDFDRIKSPVPARISDISRSASLTDLRRPSAIGRAQASEAIKEDIEPVEKEVKIVRVKDQEPYLVVPQLSRQPTPAPSDFSDDDDEDEEDSDDDDDDLGPPPEVPPPAFEAIDPEIPVIEPNASVVTLSLPQAQVLAQPQFQHPWTTPPFNITQREAPRIRKFWATVKISLSLSVVCSLLVGYGLGIKIVKVGPWSFGMYGLLLVIDFTVQTIAASFNRRRVNKLTRNSPIVKGVSERLALRDTATETQPTPLPECSIAVVGYREDEEAWISCLKSLQAQEFPIKHVIGVVDGNDGPDLDMADAFGKAFPEDQRLIVHLPVLLSVMYKEKYWETIKALNHPPLTRWQYFKMWLTQAPRPGQGEAHQVAWSYILNYLHTKATEERWADWRGICFSQPHGHKRHAMFTAFMVGAYALGTKDAMLTTDSDTYVHPDAVKNMMALLFSDDRIAGVTGDVRIWNKSDSFLALMSSIRYWFAFNVERACQSAFGCVGCLSGPLGLYRTADLMSVLGPWILQSFLGKETTFGDDRHLSNRILSLGHKTGYTHLAMCDSDTPASYVRWVKQQTRWSKSFFREAFWFPKSFAYHDFWLTVETTKQFLYPMVLTATVIRMLYTPSEWIRPVIWLATMFGVAVIKSIYGVILLRDPKQLLFGLYGFMYFFGLLPSKLFACFTVHITNWGTSARSKSEFARPESFLSRTTHVGHLAVWYTALSVGLGYFLATIFSQPFFWLISIIGLAPVSHVYSDVIIGETKYYLYMAKKKWRARRGANAKVEDVEKAAAKKHRRILKKLRRSKKSDAAAPGPVVAEAVPQVIAAGNDVDLSTVESHVPSLVSTETNVNTLDAVPATPAMPPEAPSTSVSRASTSSGKNVSNRKPAPPYLALDLNEGKVPLVRLRTVDSTTSAGGLSVLEPSLPYSSSPVVVPSTTSKFIERIRGPEIRIEAPLIEEVPITPGAIVS
ncbi:hypothetical protein AcW1_002236 [Taiwanofungus camphoratus]|nr:hypothetical protein AcV5_010230 [Antrodia cinnamomea]KAI0944555.1 hypothetical protein AcW1_002236 [Antrodia cinnamomea]